MGDPASVGRSSRGGKNVDCSKSSRELIEDDLSCLKSFGSVGVSSCPQHVGGQIIDVVSASPKEGDAVQSNIGRSSSQQVGSIWESLDVDNSFGTERSSSKEKNLGSSILGKQIGKKSIRSGKK
ncbi:hypothetical protein LWI29_011047 [Acer saccharum]|uniref:Uncharacterized protein n=1 Tax=Acer saccharum TaxID=4024 RepID=A0AA39RHQ9_ACESA|nr:hypothetical protein LWI29_011047 [Acer saccharum]